uniref:Uncharacterized protein n=1 Tax=Vitis vinifera TaxID=29760 RepID=F6HTZ4_VITVI
MGGYGMDEWGISGKGGGCGSEGEWIWLRIETHPNHQRYRKCPKILKGEWISQNASETAPKTQTPSKTSLQVTQEINVKDE